MTEAPGPGVAVGEESVEETGSLPAEAGPAHQPPGADGSAGEEPAAAEPVVEVEQVDEVAVARAALADRTADLQRVQAEFLNYKRRVERDRELTRENATYSVLAPITEVLDTIDRAREHAQQSEGGLEGGLKAVAEQLERIVSGLGLSKFGEPGDPFDPTLHEALSHIGTDPEVTVPTAKVVAKAGYKIGDRVVRAAQVLVVEPDGSDVDAPRGSDQA